jgi:multimeric flavodoxin WrbA
MGLKIIGASCSPRKGKSTRFALDAALDSARESGVAVEVIDLAEMTINGCIACGKCNKELACSQKDDFPDLIPLLSGPDVGGIIIATPVYFGTMTAQCKAFLDRCVMFRRNGALFSNKVGGVVAVGGFRNGGQETAIHAVHAAMLIQDMIIVGDGFNTFHFGGTVWSGHPEGYEKDDTGLASARNLGKRVADVAARVRA